MDKYIREHTFDIVTTQCISKLQEIFLFVALIQQHHAMSLDDLGSLQLLDYVIAMTLLDDLLDDEDDNELPLYPSEYDDYDLY